MKPHTPDTRATVYAARKEKLLAYMRANGISAAVFEDTEGRRSPAVRYYSGHPNDALLVMGANGKTVLVPWDEHLAHERAADCDIVPLTLYGRNSIKAVKAVLDSLGVNGRQNVDIPPETPYPLFLRYVDALDGWDVRCRDKGLHRFVTEQRACKDDDEIACTREAALIGDLIIDEIEAGLRDGMLKTESDVALLIEKECRRHGCERTGFDTLAAGPGRSWAIHAFPGYTDAPWGTAGLSILDFGVVYDGYTSDTTITVAKAPLSAAQESLVALVERAAQEALPFYQAGSPVRRAGKVAENVFAKAKRTMPHTLGHGIGLEIHEYPRVSGSIDEETVFQAGMIVTLEPGLYDPALGGVRLENDVLITETGNEVLTHARIIRC
ncbi:MAG: Xaa-Pro peptidase family protein [Treponemataceae bacterium]|nr:Xaa-Pro peptidase family protein [Treponemataceae bacterium]